MTKLIYKTKGNSDPRGKPRVYFSCHPCDFDKFEAVCEDIFKTHDCTVYYKEDINDELPEETRETDLGSMNLFVFPVTFRFLNEKSKAFEDLAFAKKELRPILPIMFEYDGGKAVLPIYSRDEFFGKRQFIARYSTDFTEISYEDKLKKYLESTLISKETAEKIRKAFDAYIFLSYRKKDRKYANELMNLIHKDPVCRDIAIWFDEFLTPGESFEESIDKAMKESKLFTLLVTPSLLEENNYVKCVEYPRAVESGLHVLPAEKAETDRKALAEGFKDLPEVVNANDEEIFHDAFLEAVKGIAKHEQHNDPMHNYLMGLAYLNGIDVEINTEYGVELVTKAAEAELPEAMKKLFNMYKDGEYVDLNYEKARVWAERLYEFYRRENGGKDKKTLTWLNDLALSYSNLGNYKKATELQKVCYEIKCKVLGIEHPDTLISLGNLAILYLDIGKYEKAIKLAKECYEIHCRVLGRKHPDTLFSLDIIVLSYLNLGNYKKALELEKVCYEIRCRVLGREHPDTLTSLNNLAVCYSDLGYYEKAVEFAEKCYKSMCNVFGREHPKTLGSLDNLATCYSDLGYYEKAIELAEKCYEMYCNILGREHPDTLTSLNNLANCYFHLCDYEKALELAEKCYETHCRVLGEKHPYTLISLGNLANNYSYLGNYEKALELAKECYESMCDVLGKKHPDTIDILEVLKFIRSKLK